MKAKFTLLARSGQKFSAVEVKRGKFVEPPGSPRYYVRYTDKEGKRQVQSLGTNFAAACADIQSMEIAREYVRRGIEPPDALAAKESSLADRIAEYLEEIKNNKARKTWQAYSNSLGFFKASVNKSRVQGVVRADMLAFKSYLRDKAELSHRSVYNNFLNVIVFLKWAGVKFDPRLTLADWPPKPEREPEEYTDEEINLMLNAASGEERLILNSFLCTALRSGELAHLTYGDIDFKYSIWTVQPKLDWTTKTEESQRDVPAPVWLTQKIAGRMKDTNSQRDALIFPNLKGKADLHLLRIVKRVAKVAKIEGRVDDHKFRSTCITRWLRDGKTVPEVMRWVGHVDPNTLLRYAAKANIRDAQVHKSATAAFERFSGVGD
jgi:integrase